MEISGSLWYVDFVQSLLLCSEFWWRRIEVERSSGGKVCWAEFFLVEKISDIGMGLGSFWEFRGAHIQVTDCRGLGRWSWKVWGGLCSSLQICWRGVLSLECFGCSVLGVLFCVDIGETYH
ncbi:hypothetical protein U1Q18_008578 [Sarracenia purpurea var. burkii]